MGATLPHPPPMQAAVRGQWNGAAAAGCRRTVADRSRVGYRRLMEVQALSRPPAPTPAPIKGKRNPRPTPRDAACADELGVWTRTADVLNGPEMPNLRPAPAPGELRPPADAGTSAALDMDRGLQSIGTVTETGKRSKHRNHYNVTVTGTCTKWSRPQLNTFCPPWHGPRAWNRKDPGSSPVDGGTQRQNFDQPGLCSPPLLTGKICPRSGGHCTNAGHVVHPRVQCHALCATCWCYLRSFTREAHTCRGLTAHDCRLCPPPPPTPHCLGGPNTWCTSNSNGLYAHLRWPMANLSGRAMRRHPPAPPTPPPPPPPRAIPKKNLPTSGAPAPQQIPADRQPPSVKRRHPAQRLVEWIEHMPRGPEGPGSHLPQQ